jgi:hypothetical protein
MNQSYSEIVLKGIKQKNEIQQQNKQEIELKNQHNKQKYKVLKQRNEVIKQKNETPKQDQKEFLTISEKRKQILSIKPIKIDNVSDQFGFSDFCDEWNIWQVMNYLLSFDGHDIKIENNKYSIFDFLDIFKEWCELNQLETDNVDFLKWCYVVDSAILYVTTKEHSKHYLQMFSNWI